MWLHRLGTGWRWRAVSLSGWKESWHYQTCPLHCAPARARMALARGYSSRLNFKLGTMICLGAKIGWLVCTAL